jgi:hypothetical protein
MALRERRSCERKTPLICKWYIHIDAPYLLQFGGRNRKRLADDEGICHRGVAKTMP